MIQIILGTSHMKNFVLIALFCLAATFGSYAQKYVYVDTKYILEQIPEYEEAQQELNKLSIQWQREIEGQYAEIKKKRDTYESEKILLDDATKKLKEDELAALEREAREMQKKRFGVGGDLFKKRQELIQPIQDKIFKAIKDLAKDSNYSFVFDKANSSNILFAEPKLDVSDRILRKMGISAK